MQFIENLISKIGIFVFFLLLEILSVFLMFSNSRYHKSVLGEHFLAINGYFSGKVNYITHYWNLPNENEKLAHENALLKQTLSNLKLKPENFTTAPLRNNDSIFSHQYLYKTALIVDYSLRKRDNYFLINKGSADGIKEDMAVLSSNGLVGAVLSTSKHYASVISILHSKTNIKARVKNLNYFGIIQWNGEDHRKLSLTEIPKYLPVKIGDTVITAGASAIYPEGQLIGRISKLSPNEKTGDFNIEVSTFEDLANVRYVYVVENKERPAIEEAEKKEKGLSNDE